MTRRKTESVFQRIIIKKHRKIIIIDHATQQLVRGLSRGAHEGRKFARVDIGAPLRNLVGRALLSLDLAFSTVSENTLADQYAAG